MSVVETVRSCIFYGLDPAVEVLPVIVENAPVKMSEILSASHALCEECCSLYTPCHVGEWISHNPELYDSEIGCFHDIITTANRYIDFDVKPYTDAEINTFDCVSSVNRADRLRQLYTVASKLYPL